MDFLAQSLLVPVLAMEAGTLTLGLEGCFFLGLIPIPSRSRATPTRSDSDQPQKPHNSDDDSNDRAYKEPEQNPDND